MTDRESAPRSPVTTADIVVSGVPYAVVEVDGQPPGGLGHFLGPRVLVLRGPSGWHEVTGEGTERHGRVRFFQKDGRGRDVRVWQISAGADGGYAATPGG